MVALFVAITDGRWFEHLSRSEGLKDVNFWQHGGTTTFRALDPGELFLFKLHSPLNYIVGGGIFAHATKLPVSLAWETFGEANGASSLSEMRERIKRYRSINADENEDYTIGCRILNSPFFFEEGHWIAVPDSFSRHVQQGKCYQVGEGDGRWIWEQVHDRLQPDALTGLGEAPARYGEPMLIKPRLGQAGFRIAVIDAYDRRCAVTGEKILPVLEAAHIRPYAEGGDHTLPNGILLRTDIHRLFDKGYVTVGRNFRFEVSRRIKEDFDNGKYYYSIHGQCISIPQNAGSQPDQSELNWHNSNVFLG